MLINGGNNKLQHNNKGKLRLENLSLEPFKCNQTTINII